MTPEPERPTAPPQGWFRRLWGVIRPLRGTVVIAFGSAALATIGLVYTPIVVRSLVDGSIRRDDGTLTKWLLVLVVLAVLRGATIFGRRWYGGQVSIDVEADLRKAIHDHLQTLDPATHDALAQGQVVSRANADVSMVSQLLALLPILSSSVVQLVLSLVVMAFLSPSLTLVTLFMVPLLFLVSGLLRKWVFPASLAVQQQVGEMASNVEEAVSGVRVVKGFGQEHREMLRIEAASREVFRARAVSVRLTARYSPWLQALPSFGLVAMLAVGGRQVVHGSLTIGTLLAFLSYLNQLVAPIRMAGLVVGLSQQARAGGERIFELLDYAPRIVDASDASTLADGPGTIEFDDVTVAYPGGVTSLHGFSLRIAPGETVALVGASGSGKSTAALMVPRFNDPTTGSVRVDGTDIRTVTLASLRRRIGFVFEDAYLFSSSIHDNIAFGRPDATEAEVHNAAKMAEADRFIEALQHGYQTVVGEHGLTLSGGQRQRIGLARALLTDPRILVLDDATSALDTRTEAEIHDTLRRVMRGRTTIVVAHRRSSLALASRLIVMDAGRVLDEGTHDELMTRCQTYRLLLSGPGAEGEDAVVEAPARTGSPTDSPTDGTALSLVGASADRAFPEGTPSSESAALNGRPSAGWPSGEGLSSANGTPGAALSGAPVGMGPVTNMGSPMGGAMGGRGGGMMMGMGGPMGGGFGYNPSPKTLAMMEKLPPATDTPRIEPGPAVADAEADGGPLNLRKEIRPDRWPIALGLGLVALDTVLSLLGPALIKRGLDRGVADRSIHALNVATIVFLAVTFFDVAIMWAQSIVTALAGERLLYRLRLRVFAHLQRLGLDFYEQEMVGRILTRMTGDIDALTNLLNAGLIQLIVAVLSLFGIFGFLLVYNWRLALVALASLPPLIAATWWFRQRSRVAYEAVRDRVATVNANLSQSLSGVRVTQAFTREERNTKDFASIVGSHREARLAGQWAASVYFPIVETLSVLSTAAVLWAGAALVRGGSLTTGALVAFVLYLGQFFAPIQQLSVVIDTWQQASAAVGKLRGLIGRPSSTPAAPAPVPLPAATGRIEFRDVRFAYRVGAQEALRGVSLVIEPGSTVAFVGETGAGKSTLIKLVARYYDPTAGAVLVDGINLRDVALDQWRHQLGVVPQEPALFSGSIAANIAYGRPDAPRAEVEAAAEAVGAHDFISSLPDGYDTTVAGRGRSLSAGQRQLIALARASLVNPKVLLLDEATANLDLGTEARVQAAMGVLARDRTTLLIAHRLDTARRADRIVVLSDGRIVEDGSHDRLVAAGGTYARLWAASNDVVEPQSVAAR